MDQRGLKAAALSVPTASPLGLAQARGARAQDRRHMTQCAAPQGPHQRQRGRGLLQLRKDDVAVDVPGRALVPHFPPMGREATEDTLRELHP